MANPIDISKHCPDEQPSNPFAVRIQAACKQRGLSVRKLAAEMEYAADHVQKVYNGEVYPGKTLLSKMCQVLQIDENEMDQMFKIVRAQKLEEEIGILLRSGLDLSKFPLLSQIKKPKAN